MKRYISPQVLKANKLARKLKKENSPISGENAFMFWSLCSGNHITVHLAKYLYLKAGYTAFKGYPLERK